MSLYDFYMYLKYIEHSAENLEFYVWYLASHWLPLNDSITMNRFKNYENGRLTAFPELPRAMTPLDGKSFTDSEKSLANPGNEEKFSSETSVVDEESSDNNDFENGEPFPPGYGIC